MAGTHRAPAFQFYPKDWLSDGRVRVLTFAQKGAYWDLLASMWVHSDDHCWLPLTTARKLVGKRNLDALTTGDDPVLLVDRAVENPEAYSDQDYVSSSRLHEVAQEQSSQRNKKSLAGKISGEVRRAQT